MLTVEKMHLMLTRPDGTPESPKTHKNALAAAALLDLDDELGRGTDGYACSLSTVDGSHAEDAPCLGARRWTRAQTRTR